MLFAASAVLMMEAKEDTHCQVNMGKINILNMQNNGGVYFLVNKMYITDHSTLYKYFHMFPERIFFDLLSLVSPSISHEVTKLCNPILSGECLAITLCYLVTGDSVQTISFSYKGIVIMHQSTTN